MSFEEMYQTVCLPAECDDEEVVRGMRICWNIAWNSALVTAAKVVDQEGYSNYCKNLILTCGVDENGNQGGKITDGFGNYWSKTCPSCGEDSMEVIRPGKSQCGRCG